MNHIFRLVWNRRLGVLQVASEFARGRTKGGRNAEGGTRRAAWLAGVPLSLPLLALAAAPPPGTTTTPVVLAATSAVAANALPTGGKVTNGAGQLAQHGDTLTVTQQSQNLSLNWQTFNIGSQSTVDFVQPGASAIAVNRIADTNGSQIFGHLNANGQVFLINPNGVLFGQGAQVNVGGLVASTLDVNDSALGTGSLSFSGTGKGSVTNLGTINVTGGGYVALLGNQVGNQGAIHAQLGSVALAGGSAVTLNFSGNQLVSVRVDQSTLNALAQNGQLIEADGGNVWMTAGARDSLLASAVNNTGTIEAQTVQNKNGHIVLLGGMDAGAVTVAGTLDASAPNSGNGGQIETSAAKVNVADTAKITTAAQLGLSGTWLIDPTDFTIAPGNSGTVSAGTPSGDISGATLSAALSSGNVVIQSSEGSTAGTGNVNVNDTVSWSAHTLTLDAQNNININGTMTASGSAGLALNYSGTGVNVGLGGSGFGGQVNFTGSNALSINGNSYTLINTASALQGMSASGYYALAGNLVLSGNFTPIGSNASPFSGVFDGLGHTISGLTIASSASAVGGTPVGVGLFGISSGTIRNVGLLGGSVSGSGYGASIGGLVGDNRGAISNVFTTGTASGTGGAAGGGEWVGDLVGYNETTGTISNAFAKGVVSGTSYMSYFGGLVGGNYGTIRNAYATGAVSGSYGGGSAQDDIGGLVGYNQGSIQNAYATGNASWTSGGTSNVNAIGGLVGLSTGTVTDAYATGHVASGDGSDTLGGLVGFINGGTVTASYWDTTTTGQLLGTSSGSTSTSGMTGLSNAQMMQPGNYSWTIATSGGSSGTWRIYAGNTTPLIESLLTPLTINASNQTVTYNGTNQASAVVSYSSASPVLSAITLGLTNAQHAGSYSENLSSAYSTSYDLSFGTSSATLTVNPATLTPTLTNSGVTKTYNGTTSGPAGFTPTYSFSGLVSGDTGASLSNTGVAYNSAHVASATDVTVSGLAISGITGSNGSLASDYTLASTSASVAASITPATLAATLANIGLTKTYDGTTTVPTGFTPTYSYSGLVAGDTSASLTDTGAAYNSAHVAIANLVTVSGLSLSGIAGSNGSLISDYALASTSANGAATITPVTLTATLTNSGVTKTYDGTTNAPSGFTPTYSYSGLISGDTSASLSDTGVAYNSAHVGSATNVTVSGLSITGIIGSDGSQASDYTLASSSANVAATITPAPLTVSLSNTANVSKTYDGTTAAPGGFSPTYSISGLVSGDSATVSSSATPVFNSSHVVSATTIAQGGLSLASITGNGTDNSVLGDYILASTTASTGAGVASISPLVLTATAPTIGGLLTKVYDGTTVANGAMLSGGSVSGALGGDSLALNTSGIMLGYNSSHVATASSINAIGSLWVNILSSTNGSQGTDYSVAVPTIASVAGTITPATLTPTLNNSGVTKIYDGTTNAPIAFAPTYSYSGLVSGDTSATLSDTSVVYNSAHVVSATDVTVSGLGITGITGSNGSQASDYMLASTSANVAASITPAMLTAMLTNSGPTKIYDGTTAAPVGFTPMYNYIGFASGDTSANLTNTGVAYNSAHVLSANEATVSGLSISNVIGSNGSLPSDYMLASTSASVAATITPQLLRMTLSNGNVTKSYDGTTNAPAGFTPTYSYSGLIFGDTSASPTDTGMAYNSAHVASATNLTVSGLAISGIAGSNGSLASDYMLVSTSASVAATIMPAAITVSLSNITNVTKTYDGTTSAPSGFSPTYSIAGLVSGDSATVSSSATPVFNSAHVISANSITQAGLSLASITGNGTDNSVLGDYALASTTASTGGGVASISPQVLTATAPTIGGLLTKVYDGTSTANGASLIGGGVSGALSGDSLVLNASGITLAYNSSHVATASNISASGSLWVDILSSTYASLSSDYSVAVPFISPVAATITPATLTATLTNSGVTKIYDGTTKVPTGFNPAYSLSGLVSGDTGANLSDTSVAYNSARVASATDVTVSGLSIGGIVGSNGSQTSDYTLASTNASVAASITPATLAASLGGPISKVYDGTTVAMLAPGNYTLTGVIGSDVVSLNDPASGLYSTANAGSGINVEVSGLAIGGSGASNYMLGNSAVTAATGIITPAPLTITANNASAIYNAHAYSGGSGVTYSGFVDGQTTAVLAGALTYGGSSQGALNVGNYALTPGGLTSGNYAITYSSGTLTVTPATLTYLATPMQIFAGQAVPSLTGTVSGFQGSDTLTNATTGALTFTTPATAQSPAGAYAMTGNGLAANDGNYVFAQAAGNALAFYVMANSDATLPGVAYVQQQLGQSAPVARSAGGLPVSTMATSDGEATVPPRSPGPAGVSDLYTPDVRVVGGGVRLP
ncbi:filamentous hemagglutinin N-terminal domain-containing protein [Dyella halodurans]|uniref:YDG domain-containing protein n=1 Tax=Dyella halodurans TaxID=1920171 RepID=A0ABV9C046_9GAMM|nr:YDG domain-containing protein [Dyella halodurans]